MDPELAKKGWELLHRDGKVHCSHGPYCKNKQFCKVGMRIEPRHVITGAVLPYWAYLQQVVGNTYEQASARARTVVKSRMSIVRVRFTGADGKEQRLVGIEVKTDAEMRRLRSMIDPSYQPSQGGAAASGSKDKKPDVKPDVKPAIGGAAGGFRAAGVGGAAASSGAPPPPAQQPFRKHEEVVIHNLQSASAQQFNFLRARVKNLPSEDPQTGRYTVSVLTNGQHKGAELSVKAQNLYRAR